MKMVKMVYYVFYYYLKKNNRGSDFPVGFCFLEDLVQPPLVQGAEELWGSGRWKKLQLQLLAKGLQQVIRPF